jgi:hypothetical protein
MKKQTGVRVEAELWEAYRELCRRQRLRPSQPIEDFLRLVVDEGFGGGSAEADAGGGEGAD